MIEQATEILAAISGSPDLMALIGSYQFKDQTTAPALVILGSSEQVSDLLEIQGLEIVINRVPEQTSEPDLTGCYTAAKTWRLYLVQYEGAAPDAAVAAADLLVAMFPGASYSQLGGGYSELAGVDQVAVTIPPYVSL